MSESPQKTTLPVVITSSKCCVHPLRALLLVFSHTNRDNKIRNAPLQWLDLEALKLEGRISLEIVNYYSVHSGNNLYISNPLLSETIVSRKGKGDGWMGVNLLPETRDIRTCSSGQGGQKLTVAATPKGIIPFSPGHIYRDLYDV